MDTCIKKVINYVKCCTFFVTPIIYGNFLQRMACFLFGATTLVANLVLERVRLSLHHITWSISCCCFFGYGSNQYNNKPISHRRRTSALHLTYMSLQITIFCVIRSPKWMMSQSLAETTSLLTTAAHLTGLEGKHHWFFNLWFLV